MKSTDNSTIVQERSHENIIILGFGSEALSDDGLPLKIVDDLRKVFSDGRLTFKTSPVGGIEICELLDGYSNAILFDTVRTFKCEPGELHISEYPDYMETFHLSSQHDLTFEQALRLGEQLGFHMPARIIVVAVEIFENRELKQSFSGILQDKYSSILNKVSILISELI